MNTRGSRGGWDACQIQLQVSNLPEEHVGRGPALTTIALVLVPVNQPQPSETRGSFDHRNRVWVTNELCKVIVDDRSRNQVRSFWEIYNSGGRGRGLSACWAITATITDSKIDSSSIVRYTVTCYMLDAYDIDKQRVAGHYLWRHSPSRCGIPCKSKDPSYMLRGLGA